MPEISSTDNHQKTNNASKNQKNKPVKPSTGRTPSSSVPPVNKKIKRPPLTHFLCIPLVTSSSKSQLEQSLSELHGKAARVRASSVYLEEEKEKRTSPTTATTTTEISPHGEDTIKTSPRCSSSNSIPCCYMPEDAIRPLGTLHLTIAVLSLGNDERLDRATQTLQSLNLSNILRDVLQQNSQKGVEMASSASSSTSAITTTITTTVSPPNPPTISLHSLRAMRSAKETSVLYAHPHDPTSSLLPLCEAVQSAFREAGLLEEGDDIRQLRLHATIVNTIYARKTVLAPIDGSNVRKNRKAAGFKLDARGWIREYDGHIWAKDVLIEKVSLCRMAAEKVDGVYGAKYKEVAANYFKKT